MSKEDMIMFIEMIDAQIKQNRKAIIDYQNQTGSDNADTLTLEMLSRDLIQVRNVWHQALLNEYGIYYV